MSKKQMTPKELGERKQVAKKEVTSKVLAPKDVVSKKEMTAEEFTLKRTELAIKLINSSLETPNAKQLEKVVLQISSIGLPKIENFVSKFVAYLILSFKIRYLI